MHRIYARRTKERNERKSLSIYWSKRISHILTTGSLRGGPTTRKLEQVRDMANMARHCNIPIN